MLTTARSVPQSVRWQHIALYSRKALHVHTVHQPYPFINYRRCTSLAMPSIVHYSIRREDQTLAGALSLLPITERQSTGFKNPIDLQWSYIVLASVKNYRRWWNDMSPRDTFSFHLPLFHGHWRYQSPWLFCHPPTQIGYKFVPDYESTAEAQDRDAVLQTVAANDLQDHTLSHTREEITSAWHKCQTILQTILESLSSFQLIWKTVFNDTMTLSLISGSRLLDNTMSMY